MTIVCGSIASEIQAVAMERMDGRKPNAAYCPDVDIEQDLNGDMMFTILNPDTMLAKDYIALCSLICDVGDMDEAPYCDVWSGLSIPDISFGEAKMIMDRLNSWYSHSWDRFRNVVRVEWGTYYMLDNGIPLIELHRGMT